MKAVTQSGREYRIVPAGEFKATCLQLMDEALANKNLTIIITKRGKPVAMMAAPPEGLTLSGPSVALTLGTDAVSSAAAGAVLDVAAAAVVEEHRHKKRKRKKKHK